MDKLLQILIFSLIFLSTPIFSSLPTTSLSAKVNHHLFTEEEEQWLIEHPNITIAHMDSWAPISFIDQNGKSAGISVDIIKAINKRIGNKLKLVPGEWNNIYAQAKEGKIDAILDITPLSYRKPFFNFTSPYLTIPQAIIGRSDGEVLKTEASILNKRIALEKGFFNVKHFKEEHPSATVLEYSNTSAALDAVARHEADVYVGNRAIAQYIIKTELLQNLKIHGRMLKNPSILTIGSRKNLPILNSILEKAHADISLDEKHIILERWASTPEALDQDTVQLVTLSATEQQWLTEHPTIRFMGDPNWLPYEAFDKSGNYIGMVAEHLKLIEQKLGIKIDIIPTQTWAESISLIKQNKADILSETLDSKLTSHLSFTQSYITSPVVIVMNDDTGYIEDISQIKHLKLAIVSDYGYLPKIIKTYPEIGFIKVKTLKEGLTAVSTGKIDALIATLAQTSYQINELGIHNIRIVGETSFNAQLAFGMRKDFTPLIPLFNRALNAISQAEKQKIFNQWGKQKFATKTDYMLLLKIVLAAILILSIILYWNRRLASEVTQRIQSEKEINALNKRFSLAVDMVSLGVWELNTNDHSLFLFDDKMFEIYGFEKTDYVSAKQWINAIHPSDRVAMQKHFDDLKLGGGQGHTEFRILHPDGRIRTIYSGISVVLENNVVSKYIGVNWDISRLKETELELELEKQKAEQANKSKSDFLANMSHEIRTPMNAIIGMSYLALQTELDKKQRNYIEKVNYSAEMLLHIINDILDFSKIEAGKMDIEKTDFQLEDVLEHLTSTLGFKTAEKELELLFDVADDVPTSLNGDSLRLGQILLNLGSNSVKFTAKGEVIVRIQLLHSTEQQVTLQFSIQDSGIGMTEQQQAKLFQAFSQADSSTTRKYGGTGLGLTISKNLTQLMGGELWAESEYGKGSTFHFTANFGLSTLENKQVLIPVDNLIGMRILVVDDNASAREIFSNLLTSLKFTVDSAKSGQEAIHKLAASIEEKEPYRLIIIDWQMPSMDGFATINEITTRFASEQIPKFIIATAYGKDEALEAGQSTQVTQIVTKPANASTLFDAIMSEFGHNIATKARLKDKQDNQTKIYKKLHGAKVLLVEDNEFNQELAIELLTDKHISVILARNGQEALDMLEKESVDGVLMDIQMPIMDGYTATRKLREQQRFETLPIIAMSANVMASDIAKATDSGMNDHIGKPINVDEMFRVMARWITPSTPIEITDEETDNTTSELSTYSALIGIDINVGLATTQNNHKLYQKLLSKFKNSQRQFESVFLAALDGADETAALREAHTLKSTSGSIGAKAIQDAAKALETACDENAPIDSIKALLKQTLQALEPVISSIENLNISSKPTDSQVREINVEEMTLLMRELHQLLKNNSFEATEKADMLLSHLELSQYNNALNNIQQACSEYDFDQALNALNSLAKQMDISL